MRFSAAVLGSLVLGASFVAASDVIDLTADNFKASVDAEDLMLVEFFAPWCGHCKALAPEYEEAATTLKKEGGAKLAKVDCVEHADLCQANNVEGYPTLKVFRNGKDKEYGGPRKADGIVSYMKKQALPALSVVTSDNHTKFIKDDKVVVVAYTDAETDALVSAIKEAAESHRDDYLFGATTDPAAIKEAGVTPPALVVYKSFDEGRVDLPADAVKSASVDAITAFVKENAVPHLDEIGGENYPTYAQSGLPLAYLFLDPTDSKTKDELIAEITPVAKQFKGKVNFVWIDAVKYAQHAQSLNLLETKWPAFVVDDMPQSLKYPLDQSADPTATSVTSHVSDFLAGKLQPKLKSDPVPETQDDASYTLVGTKFEEVVFDDSKDVFAEFYAPWCGHCKRLKPVWENLAELYKDQKDKLTVLKMDATTNDLPASAGFKISGFPALKFKPAGTRDFIEYEGDRSLESLIEFVQTHAKNKVSQPEVKPEPAPEATTAPAAHEEL